MRISDIFLFIVIMIIIITPNIFFGNPNRKFFTWLINKPKWRLERKFVVIKVTLILLVLGSYFLVDTNNLISKYLGNIFHIKFLVSPINDTGELLSFWAIGITVLTFIQKSFEDIKKNDTDQIYKLIDIIEKRMANNKEDLYYQEIEDMRKIYMDKDIRRLFILKDVILKNREEIVSDINRFKETESYKDFRNFENSFGPLLKLEKDYQKSSESLSLFYLESIMTILINKKVLAFTEEPYERKLKKSFIRYRDFDKLNLEMNFFNLIKKNYFYLLINEKKFEKMRLAEHLEYCFKESHRVSEDTHYVNRDNFRLIHRCIKSINYSSLSFNKKKNMYGVLRAVLPDSFLLVLFYNCTYGKAGYGLGAQLAGTSFFSTPEDISISDSFSQHFKIEELLNKTLDPEIMLELYHNPTILPGSYSSEEFHSYVSTFHQDQRINHMKHK